MHNEPPGQASTPTDEQFSRYLSGELPAAEREQFEGWIARDPSRRAMLDRMELAWSVLELPAGATPAQQERFRRRLQAEHSPVLRLFPGARGGAPRGWRPGHWHGWAAAAAVLVVAASALFVEREVGRRVAPQVVEAEADSSRFMTRRGQRATITLTDGSTVVLDVGSRLTVAPGFGKGARVVVLDGAAYFDVVSDSATPFEVRTSSSVTRVLGTAFVVRQHEADEETSIAVERGRVAIGRDGPTTTLDAGDVGAVHGSGRTSVRHDPGAVTALVAWKDGWFTLVDAPMSGAASQLARWYDLDVRVPSAVLRARRVSASFRHESPDAVLRSIADVIGARVVRDGRTVTFYPR